jgi:hypothetical protein
MKAKRILLAIALALTAAATAHAQAASTDSGPKLPSSFPPDREVNLPSPVPADPAPYLQGGWKATLTPEEGGPPPFLALFTFTKDGGVVQTDAGPPTPLQFSTGHGGWRRVGRRDFVITYTQLQFDASQNLDGIFRGRITARLNNAGDALTGRLTVDFFDLHGNLLFSGNGTVKAQRLPVLGAN